MNATAGHRTKNSRTNICSWQMWIFRIFQMMVSSDNQIAYYGWVVAIVDDFSSDCAYLCIRVSLWCHQRAFTGLSPPFSNAATLNAMLGLYFSRWFGRPSKWYGEFMHVMYAVIKGQVARQKYVVYIISSFAGPPPLFIINASFYSTRGTAHLG